MPKPLKPAVCIILAIISIAPAVRADVLLPKLFSNHMVLQQGMPVPVWGTAAPGEEVTVAIDEQKVRATADTSGKWLVHLAPLKVGSLLEMTVTGRNRIKVTDILVGEVWMASGQSNMVWWVKTSLNPEQEKASADYVSIRMFTAGAAVSGKPMNDVPGSWQVCSPATVADFSAAGYFFARELHKTLNVPVGMITSAVGGTPAESWVSRPSLEADADLRGLVERWDQSVSDYGRQLHAFRKWTDESTAAESRGEPVAAAPPLPPDPRSQFGRASGLYNAMIAPIVPYAIRGTIWYQGEANAVRAYQYRKLFPALIQDWRQAWGQGDFPFLFVQLANYETSGHGWPKDGTWAELREAQTMALKIRNTSMVVTIDIGDPADIHPKNKQEVGRRLALAAQAVAYRKQLVHAGPMYESMSVEGRRTRIRFASADGLKTLDGQRPRGFTIAAEDKKFVDATAEIDGDTVVVWSDAVAAPAAVRYGWSDCPVCTLFNRADLPASPFRTDDWAGLTINEK